MRGEGDQRASEDIGDDQVERRALFERGMVEAITLDQPDLAAAIAQRNRVEFAIFLGNRHRDRIDIAGDDFCVAPQMVGGKGEQAGAGTDIGDIAKPVAGFLEPVEALQASHGGFMMAGAKSLSGIDADIGQLGIFGWQVARRMHVEATGAQRFEALLAERDPVFVDQPFVGTTDIGLAGDDGGR